MEGIDIFKILLYVGIAYLMYLNLKDIRKDQHKAATWHVIAIVFLVYTYSRSFNWLGWLLLRNKDFHERIDISVGFAPSYVTSIIYTLNMVFGLTMMFQVFGLIKRSDVTRKFTLLLLPWAIPITTFIAYLETKQYGNMEVSDTVFFCNLFHCFQFYFWCFTLSV